MLKRGRDLSEAVEEIVFVHRDKKRERLDRVLLRALNWDSRSKIQKLIQLHRVTVNGQRPKVATRVGAGDVIRVQVILGDMSTPSEGVEIPANAGCGEQPFPSTRTRDGRGASYSDVP